jgi:segregation and condensation protein A
MIAYELKLENYSGPLQKLLELIEEKELEISEISLARVTDDFLRYLEEIGKIERSSEENLRLLADFVVVASRLIFIKSKTLLPDLVLGREEEEKIKDLEVRLRLYRELKPAMRNIARLWKERREEFSRPYFTNAARWTGANVFFPGKVSAEGLARAMDKMWQGLSGFMEEGRLVREKIATLEETIKEVVKRLGALREVSFAKLSLAKSRAETIVTFLAILHLAREQLIFIEQDGHFSDIIIKKNQNGE